jgi:hypothetical protein
MNGTAAGKLGQLVVTGERVIGMMTRGSAGGAKLDDSAGCVYAFAASRDDLRPAEAETNRKGSLTQALIRSRTASTRDSRCASRRWWEPWTTAGSWSTGRRWRICWSH